MNVGDAHQVTVDDTPLSAEQRAVDRVDEEFAVPLWKAGNIDENDGWLTICICKILCFFSHHILGDALHESRLRWEWTTPIGCQRCEVVRQGTIFEFFNFR